MKNKIFSKKEALVFGWETTKKNFFFFIKIFLVAMALMAIAIILEILLQVLLGKERVMPLNVFIYLVSSFISLGTIKIALKIYDNQKTEISDFFSSFSLFLNYLVGSVVYSLIYALGLLLLIVPGVILGIRLMFFGYLMVDRGLKPLEALKKSFVLTRGSLKDLFLFEVIAFLIIFGGVLLLGLGTLLTGPTVLMATVFIYRKLLSEKESLLTQESVSLVT